MSKKCPRRHKIVKINCPRGVKIGWKRLCEGIKLTKKLSKCVKLAGKTETWNKSLAVLTVGGLDIRGPSIDSGYSASVGMLKWLYTLWTKYILELQCQGSNLPVNFGDQSSKKWTNWKKYINSYVNLVNEFASMA